MEGELVEAPEGDEHREGDRAAGPSVERRPRPDLAPGEAGDEVQERLGEGGRARRRGVDVGVAEHRAPHGHPPERRGTEEMVEHCGVEALGLLDAGQVRGAGQDGDGRPGDPRGEVEDRRRRADGVEQAADDERGCADRGEVVVEVGGGDRLAAACVALRGARGEHPRDLLEHLRVAGSEGLGEPSSEQGVGELGAPPLPDGRGSLVPGAGRRERRGRAGEDERLDPLGMAGGDEGGDHPAEGDPAQRRPLHAEGVEQADEVASEVRHRVGPGRGARAAMPPVVVAEQAEAPGERPHLRVPHLGRRAERARQDEDRRPRRSVEAKGHLGLADSDPAGALLGRGRHRARPPPGASCPGVNAPGADQASSARPTNTPAEPR